MPIEVKHDSELGDVISWIINHDAVIEERWDSQWRWNKDRDAFEDKLQATIDRMKSQLAFIAGGSALAGALIPTVFQAVVRSLGAG